MLAVIPQQAVGHVTYAPLGPARDLLSLHGARAGEPAVHGVHAHRDAVRKVCHRIHTHARAPAHAPEHEARVGDGGERALSGERRQDVGHEMRHAVIPEIDTEVHEERARHLEHVPAAQRERVLSLKRRRRWWWCRGRALSLPSPRPRAFKSAQVGEERESVQQQRERIVHGSKRRTARAFRGVFIPT